MFESRRGQVSFLFHCVAVFVAFSGVDANAVGVNVIVNAIVAVSVSSVWCSVVVSVGRNVSGNPLLCWPKSHRELVVAVQYGMAGRKISDNPQSTIALVAKSTNACDCLEM